MSDTSKTVSSGISTSGLLGVVFVTLKLCHVIDWSWWWVTCPFWAGLAVLALILAFMGIAALLALIVAALAAIFSK